MVWKMVDEEAAGAEVVAVKTAIYTCILNINVDANALLVLHSGKKE